MAEITATMVKELRESTGVGMMECKRALQEANGNAEEAVKVLRERGLSTAAKKSTRTAKSGLIAAAVSEDGRTAAMVEVNCETDFVARNDNFQAFVAEMQAAAFENDSGALAQAVNPAVVQKITEIGENIVIRRNTRFQLEGAGALASYVHMGGKVGVLIEVGCEKADSAAQLEELLKDLCLHVCAAAPQYLDRSEVPEDIVAAESAIFAKQAEGKPAQIVDKIVSGKIEKYYSQICLVEQGFVKDPDISISQMLESKGKEIGDTLVLKRYARYMLGE